MKRLTVTHNGMKIEFLKEEKEVNNYINSVLNNYRDLRPKKIVDVKIDDNTRVVIYMYYTLYKEMFLIEAEEY